MTFPSPSRPWRGRAPTLRTASAGTGTNGTCAAVISVGRATPSTCASTASGSAAGWIRRASARSATSSSTGGGWGGTCPCIGRERAMPPKGVLLKPLPEHGTHARYIHRLFPCRCAACTKANTEYNRDYRARKRAIKNPNVICDICGLRMASPLALGGHKSGHTKRGSQNVKRIRRMSKT